MSPTTLTMPSVTPPARTNEAAGNLAADGEGGDAFADALQRAQSEPKLARGNESHAQASKPADAHAHARATRHAQAKDAASEKTQPTAGDAAGSEPAASIASGESTTVDTPLRGDKTAQDASNQALPPLVAIEAPVTPPAPIEANRCDRPCAADTEDPALAVDARAAVGRTGPRSGGTPELRAGPSMPGRATLPNEPANPRDTAAAAPLRAAIEHVAPDAGATPMATLRAPSFERPAVELSTTPLAANLIARELSAPAASNVESKLSQATLHAAIDEPGFGAGLGRQVALWVRDGVQEARLQLHPAELGPVTVQIALDGRAAQVDFTAAVAATRESIEQSLPALAAALRESGFTLTGGGVSSHAGQGDTGDGRRERTPGHQGNRSHGDAGADAGPAASQPRRWTRSLLDVYA